jgi:hypothetical protein
MNPELSLPIISSLGWLALVGGALVSHQLGWRRIVAMALAWIAIFAGLYVMVEWFMFAQNTASAYI